MSKKRTAVTFRLSAPYRAILSHWAERLGVAEADIQRLALGVLSATDLSANDATALLDGDGGGAPFAVALDARELEMLDAEAAKLGLDRTDVLRVALRTLETVRHTPEEVLALAALGRARVSRAAREKRKG